MITDDFAGWASGAEVTVFTNDSPHDLLGAIMFNDFSGLKSNFQFPAFNLNDRFSGFIEYGGDMFSGFVGDMLGRNGKLYGTESNLWAPNSTVNFPTNELIINLREAGELASSFAEARDGIDNLINNDTYVEIITVDTIKATMDLHTKTVHIEIGRFMLSGKKADVGRIHDSINNVNYNKLNFFKLR